jgi:hypothetical protein
MDGYYSLKAGACARRDLFGMKIFSIGFRLGKRKDDPATLDGFVLIKKAVFLFE